jgi:pyoverdine/dityrosine biosynthesis protein Dit1
VVLDGKSSITLQMGDNVLIDSDSEPPLPSTQMTDDLGSFVEHRISSNALHGFMGAITICFKRKIQGVDVRILLDSDNFNNFLQSKIDHCLKISIQPSGHFHNINSIETSLMQQF